MVIHYIYDMVIHNILMLIIFIKSNNILMLIIFIKSNNI